MALRFLGINPGTPEGGSPTLWLDEKTGDYILQSYREDDPEILDECRRTGEIPEHEIVIRWPAAMVQFFPEARGRRRWLFPRFVRR